MNVWGQRRDTGEWVLVAFQVKEEDAERIATSISRFGDVFSNTRIQSPGEPMP